MTLRNNILLIDLHELRKSRNIGVSCQILKTVCLAMPERLTKLRAKRSNLIAYFYWIDCFVTAFLANSLFLRQTILPLMLILISVSLPCCSLWADNTNPPDDTWLYEQFAAGNIDTLRLVLDLIPEQTAAGQFFRGIFERNGESARFYFDRSVALYPGSLFEAWSLERLWQHHWAVGDTNNARKYLKFLRQRHPDNSAGGFIPDFANVSDLWELTTDENTLINWENSNQKYWTIQLGAFSNHNGALWVANKARKWGQVKLVNKTVRGKDLTVVHLGRFSRRRDASELESRIRSETELKGRVVSVKP